MNAASARFNGQTVRAVIFDFGDVLAHGPTPEHIARMAALLNVARDKFWEHYNAERHPYDCGRFSAEQYWSAVAQAAGARLTAEQIEWLRRTDVQMWSNINPAMLRWAGELKAAGLRTAVLSNMHADMVAAVRSDLAWITDFDCFVLSAELHMAKPDPQIFRHCLECLKVEPNEAIFIDDRERNTRAAEAVGIIGICASSTTAIRQCLQAAGWDAPLPE